MEEERSRGSSDRPLDMSEGVDFGVTDSEVDLLEERGAVGMGGSFSEGGLELLALGEVVEGRGVDVENA